MRRQRVLVACEESQRVTLALRSHAIEAFSCDLRECSGGHPQWHLHTDVRTVLDDDWSMIIAFPPCTHLACSGARWFPEKRADGRQQDAIRFFMLFTDVKCPLVAIENPVGIISTHYRKPDQIVQPWWFGDGFTKATCFWLKGLPNLFADRIVKGRYREVWKPSPGPDRSLLRSRTYPGMARAIAEQWGSILLK
jgi:site-specific DNA-cytosine methylase